jgi:hypothetical protein
MKKICNHIADGGLEPDLEETCELCKEKSVTGLTPVATINCKGGEIDTDPDILSVCEYCERELNQGKHKTHQLV